MQARYQYGDLRIRKRNKGPDVWQFRYFEKGKRKSVLVGTVEKLPTKADAVRAIEHRRIELGLSPGVRQTAKALLTVRWNCIVLQKPFRTRCASAGEAEAGSAGVQPAKE